MKKFVICVDCQRDFMDANGNLSIPGAESTITYINNYLASLKAKKTVGVLFTFDTHYPETFPQSEEGQQFPPHCYKGTTGWNLAVDPRKLDPAIPVWKLEKNVFDMWHENGLLMQNSLYDYDRDYFFGQVLKEKKVKQIEVVGVAADFCVKYAIQGLVDRDYVVFMPDPNLTKGIERQIGQVVREDFADKNVLVG